MLVSNVGYNQSANYSGPRGFSRSLFREEKFKENLWDQGISQQDADQHLSLEKCP